MVKNNCSHYLTTAKPVVAYLLQNNPWTGDSDGASSEVKVLCNLAGTILSDVKKTEIGT